MAACVVLTTVGSRRDAEHLARRLVEQKLATCVSIVPNVVSHYRWQRKLQRSREWLLLIKTGRNNWPKLLKFVRKHHPYESPELLALPVTAGKKEYLAWLNASLR